MEEDLFDMYDEFGNYLGEEEIGEVKKTKNQYNNKKIGEYL